MRTLWCLITGLLLGAAQLPADILYNVTDLGNLGGYGINNAGQVVGSLETPDYGGPHAALYNDGQVINLGTLGGPHSVGLSINDAGQITGAADISYDITHPFLYTNGQMQDLGTLGEGPNNVGNSINNAGQITGYSSGHAFLYSNGQISDSCSLVCGFSYGSLIIDSVQVTGTSSTADGHGHAFLYSNGVMTDLGTLYGGSYGTGINNAGQVTGYFYTATDDNHAFLYANGQMTDLGTLGARRSLGESINNAGQVVGYVELPPAEVSPNLLVAFLYTDGQMYDLNKLIDPALHITLYEATAINDHGQIVANGGGHAYLLTPVPEPSTWALLGVALLGLGISKLLQSSHSSKKSLATSITATGSNTVSNKEGSRSTQLIRIR